MKTLDLGKNCGLPILLKGTNIEFSGKIGSTFPDIRTGQQMRPVLAFEHPELPKEMYYMYRDLCRPEHRQKINAAGLRYDLTVIPPATIGKEYVKTFGHYHPTIPNTETFYPEVYEVIHGTAHYLLQNGVDCILVEAKEGEKAIMLPGYGHVTINPGKKTLVMANWVERNFKSIYEPIRNRKGAMYYEFTNGFRKNTNYEHIPKLRKIKPAKKIPEFGMEKGKPMYNIVKDLKKLEFLTKPQKYAAVFERLAEK